MKKIPLTQGKFALVDDCDFEWLSQWKWYAAKRGRSFYVSRGVNVKGKVTIYEMHTEILGKKKGLYIDHINGNGLDNRRSNIRHVTHRQNCQNKQNVANKLTSLYPGVSYDKTRGKWVARTHMNGTYKFLGRFKTEAEAFSAYKVAVEEYTGEEVVTDMVYSIN